MSTPKQTPKTYIDLMQMYYGNVYGGQRVLAATDGAELWERHCVQSCNLGAVDRNAVRWREFSEFFAFGLFVAPKTAARPPSFVIASLIKTSTGDNRSPYMYHWFIASLDNMILLSGDWRPLVDQFEESEEKFLVHFPKPAEPFHALDRIRIVYTHEERARYLREGIKALVEWFKFDENYSTLAILLTAVMDQKPISISGLPNDNRLRLSFVLAFASLLPPSMRQFCTFATRVIGDDTVDVLIKFVDDEQVGIYSQDISFNWKTKNLYGPIPSESHPAINYLIRLLRQDIDHLTQFLQEHDKLAVRLVKAYGTLSESLSDFVEWISLDESFKHRESVQTAVESMFRLLGKSMFTSERSDWLAESATRLITNDVTTHENVKTLLKFIDTNDDATIRATQEIVATYVASTHAVAAMQVAIVAVYEHATGWMIDGLWKWMTQCFEFLVVERRIQSGILVLRSVVEKQIAGNQSQWDEVLKSAVYLTSESDLEASKELSLFIFQLALEHLAPRRFIHLLFDTNSGWVTYLPVTIFEAINSEQARSLNLLMGDALRGTTISKESALVKMSALLMSKERMSSLNYVDVVNAWCVIAINNGNLIGSGEDLLEITKFSSSTLGTAAATLLAYACNIPTLNNDFVRLRLFGWACSQKNLIDSGTAFGVFRKLSDTNPDFVNLASRLVEAHSWFERLTSISILEHAVQYFKQLYPDQQNLLNFTMHLLSEATSSSWRQLDESIDLIVLSLSQNDANVSQAILAKDLQARLLTYSGTNPALFSKLMDWWVVQTREAIAKRAPHRELYRWVGTPDSQLDQGQRRQIFDRQFHDLLALRNDSLVELSDMAKKDGNYDLAKNLDASTVTQRLIPDGNFATFREDIQRVQETITNMMATLEFIQKYGLTEEEQEKKMQESIRVVGSRQLSEPDLRALSEQIKKLSSLLEDFDRKNAIFRGWFPFFRKYKTRYPVLEMIAEALTSRNNQ